MDVVIVDDNVLLIGGDVAITDGDPCTCCETEYECGCCPDTVSYNCEHAGQVNNCEDCGDPFPPMAFPDGDSCIAYADRVGECEGDEHSLSGGYTGPPPTCENSSPGSNFNALFILDCDADELQINIDPVCQCAHVASPTFNFGDIISASSACALHLTRDDDGDFGNYECDAGICNESGAFTACSESVSFDVG